MQDIIIEKPYKFSPPHRGKFWSWLIQRVGLFARHLRKVEGVVDHEVRGLDKLRASLDAGHGIMLTPNHCRTADPMAMGFVTRPLKTHVFAMASWHLFNQDWFSTWAIRKMGGFSVNREGIDRQSIDTAIKLLDEAARPLVLFPEGAVSRTNDRLHALLDGVAFIARTAAKRRAKRDKKVVVHPVAIKYLYQGDIFQAIDDVLTEIEQRWSWKPQRHLSVRDRVGKVGMAMLTLKELEYFGKPHAGDLPTRLGGLINRLLEPLEEEWLGGAKHGAVVPRVKALRMKMLPEMIDGTLTAQERERRWSQFQDIYLSQQVSCYLPDYLEFPSADRYLETIERYEEDLTDKARVHSHLKVVIQIGDPMDVNPKRDRSAEVDPLMEGIQKAIETMLAELGRESRVIDDTIVPESWDRKE